MAESYRFFDAVASDRQYTSADFAAVLVRFLRDGYIPGVGNELAVSATSPATMAVNVAAGEAMLQGRWYKNDAAKTINIATADSSNPRIDRIVLKLDLNPAARSITAVVKTGTPAASPAAPALTQGATVWEISLARVAVEAGAGTITAGNITDERNSTNCGIAIPPYMSTWLATVFASHKARHATGGADALSTTDIGAIAAPDSPEQGDILHYNGSSWVLLHHGTVGQVLKTAGHGANPLWADETGGGGDGAGGTTVGCQSTDLGNGDWVNFGQFTVPDGKTLSILETSIYPSGINNLVVEAYNLTDNTAIYSSNLSFSQGAPLAAAVAGKKVVFRMKNGSSLTQTGCYGFIKFSVA